MVVTSVNASEYLVLLCFFMFCLWDGWSSLWSSMCSYFGFLCNGLGMDKVWVVMEVRYLAIPYFFLTLFNYQYNTNKVTYQKKK